MPRLLRLLLGSFRRLLSSRRNLWLENLALRQQLMIFKRRRSWPKIGNLNRLFWLVARRFWSHWQASLILVTPETVVRWHRIGFRLYWRWLSRNGKTFGRKRISKELRDLIFRMVAENPTWGAPRIHGELLKLGFDVAERTVSRWVQKAPRTRALQSAGRRSCKIIAKPSRQWTSSLSLLLPVYGQLPVWRHSEALLVIRLLASCHRQ